MKTNKLVALLTVCGLFAGSASMVAHTHNGSCRTCNDRCATCPQKHEHTCEPKPTCVKYVEAYHAPCKQCTTNCNYTCPVGYETRGSNESGTSTTTEASQDEDWKKQRTYSADENGSVKKGKKMKAAVE